MIKVTVRERVYADGTYREEQRVKEHSKGNYANVYNGILTIYVGGQEPKFSEAIAGYEGGNWLSWEHF